MSKKVALTSEQRDKLEQLWFIYGNHGKKHSMRGHRFIQCLLEQDEDTRDFFKPEQEVVEAVDKVLKGKSDDKVMTCVKIDSRLRDLLRLESDSAELIEKLLIQHYERLEQW